MILIHQLDKDVLRSMYVSEVHRIDMIMSIVS
jgi:hypothetical protein